MNKRNDLIIPGDDEDPLALLTRCGGYYDCPIGADGKPKGPVVGYAARYDGVHQWVGRTYVNFAKAEEHPPVVRYCASALAYLTFNRVEEVDAFCGIPEGGKALAFDLASFSNRRHIFAEKEVLAVKTGESREKSRIVFRRHQPRPGDRLAIVEDACNNFDATDQIVAGAEKAGAKVVAILCFLNRSLKFDAEYPAPCDTGAARQIPIISLVRKPIPEYTQTDPAVAEDIAAGNVIWKPKDQLDELLKAMQAGNYVSSWQAGGQ